jgi:uncharacterized protein (TIGR03435 family)
MYRCTNCPLTWVIHEAYDLQPFEYAGPDWAADARFDFTAKIPAGTGKDDFHAMLQGLLAERFKMTVHREKKEMGVYELTVAKNGPKFVAPKDDELGSLDGFPAMPKGTTMSAIPGHARIRSEQRTMEWFARMLAGQLQGPVVDATALTGKYDFMVSWAFGPKDSETGEDYRSALLHAVQAQLGLRLEEKKGKAEVVVVDRLEKTPTEN